MEFNQLRSLPHDAFRGATSLRTLWLTGNHIEPGEPMFRRAKRHANHLTAVPPKLFQGLSQLRVLLMHHNRITSLPTGLFDDTTKLTVLKLLDNRLGRDVTASSLAFSPLMAPRRSPLCRHGQPSDGSCFQFDLREDSGDDLEDIWEWYQVTLESEDAVDAVVGKAVPRGQSRDDRDRDDEETEGDEQEADPEDDTDREEL